jgi:putative ABC transport system substrate-binding protein
MPVVGEIGLGSIDQGYVQIGALHRGLAENGFVAGQNLVFEYRSPDYHLDRLLAIAAELVRRPVTVPFAGYLAATLAAKAATQTTPIVFVMGANPVERGVVASLARPGGHITGVTVCNTELIGKRLEILHELVPSATLVALLVHPTGALTEVEMMSSQATAAALGLHLRIVDAALPDQIEEAFAQIAQSGAGALLISGDALFLNCRTQVVALVSRTGIPAICPYREVTQVGGLMRHRLGRSISNRRRVCGTHPQGREARRPTGAGIHEGRVGPQPQGR